MKNNSTVEKITTQNSQINLSKRKNTSNYLHERKFKKLIRKAREDTYEHRFDTLGQAFQYAEEVFSDFYADDAYYDYREMLFDTISDNIEEYLDCYDLCEDIEVQLWTGACGYNISAEVSSLWFGEYKLATDYCEDFFDSDEICEFLLSAVAKGLNVYGY